MRKFIIKDRKKRKYIRKPTQSSSHSISKTVYGMMPLLIALFAIITTLVISQPLHDQVNSMHFTFELPKFSLTNPLPYIEAFQSMITQMILAMIQASQTSASIFIQTVTFAATTITNGVILFNPLPVISSTTTVLQVILNAIDSDYVYLISWFMHLTTLFHVFLLSITSSIIQMLETIFSASTYFYFIILHTITSTFWTTLSSFSSICHTVFHLFIISLYTVLHWLMVLSTTIVWLVWTVVIFIGNVFTTISRAIIYGIEWPFKILFAYWLQIKPYVDIFDKHLAMSGTDLANGFASIGKMGSLLGVGK